jgi:hypothetical protein
MPSENHGYNHLIKSLSIKKITIPNLHWCLLKEPPKNSTLINEAKLEIQEPVVSRKSTVIIPAKLSVDGFIDSEKKTKFLEISVLVNLTVKISPKYYSEELIQKYIDRNAIFSIIAIFREQVRNATFQMGLPTLILPAFKVYPESLNKKSKDKQKEIVDS